MTDPGSAPAEQADNQAVSGSRRDPTETAGSPWFETMPAMAREPDLDRFLPHRGAPARGAAFEQAAAHEQAMGYGPVPDRPPATGGRATGADEHGDRDEPGASDQPTSTNQPTNTNQPTSPDQPTGTGGRSTPAAPTPEGSESGSPIEGSPIAGLVQPLSFTLAGTVEGEQRHPHQGAAQGSEHRDLPELRQIAGLTAGTIIPLDRPSLAFAEGDNEVGFRLEVQASGRVDVVPMAATVTIDATPVTEATAIGLGALDVGSARFVVRRRHRTVLDWPDDQQLSDEDPAIIEVPSDLAPTTSAPKQKRRRRLLGGSSEPERETLDAASWEFVEIIRETRGEAAERLRLLHPDPTDLADRARHDAPNLGFRRRGEPRFAEVGVLCADVSWMPRFDDIGAIPESLGDHLRPLMSLPSVPIPADLLVGPLGITGPRRAALACARHVVVSLYGLSSDELMLHVVTDPGRLDEWRWATPLAPDQRIDPRFGYPVLLVDGAHNFPGSTGLDHQKIMDGRAGLVVLADAVEQLPSYCGTVLQLDRDGGGLLTNHRGQVFKGTPIGMTESTTQELATDLVRVLTRRR
jgi:hypothetical protein